MKKIFAIGLTLVLLIGTAFPSFALGLSSEKEEVVYGVLGFDGTVEKIYVVNSFKGGTITDYGDYSKVNNMSSSEKITHEGDTVTIDTKADRFYYQGTLETKKLPWDIKIGYQLNQKKVSNTQLSGKSGDLTITLSTTPNTSVNSAFYENYMLQISLVLDTNKCTEINSPHATLANAGKNKVITHTVMPGKNADITISAKVEDFSMSGFEIAALPLIMTIELPDTEGLTLGINSLLNGVNSLNTGVERLSGGIDKSYLGIQKIKGGSLDFGKGLTQLNGNSNQIISASAQINQALNSILAGLEVGDFNQDEIAQLSTSLRGITLALNQISMGLQSLKTGYSQAYALLDASIAAIPTEDVDPSTLYAAIGVDVDLNAKLDELMGYYAAAKTVKQTYAGIKTAFDAVEQGLDSSLQSSFPASISTIAVGLSVMADGIDQSISGSDIVAQLQQLKEGLSRLSTNYGQFHAGLGEYAGGLKLLSSNYGEFDSGLKAFTEGMSELNSGGKELSQGTGKLSDAVAELPTIIETEIDKIASQYDKSDFVPVSFVSEKNIKITAVQFVIKTASVEVPKDLQTENQIPVKQNFWQKLFKLFGL